MAVYNVLTKKRNPQNTDWDSVLPITIAENVLVGVDGASVATELDYIKKSILVNVITFGARGNGVTDDTEAIQNAINYVNTYGGVVYFPSGSYKISSPLTISASCVALKGDGIGKTFINSVENINLIKIGSYNFTTDGEFNSSSWMYYFSISGITFNNGYTGGSKNTGAIVLRAVQFVKIDECRFENMTKGVEIHECSHHVHITGCQFVTTEAGISVNNLGSSANYNSTGHRYISNSFLSGLYGVLFEGNSFGDCIISHNTFIGTTSAGVKAIKASTSFYSTKIGVYNNDFDGIIACNVFLVGCNDCIISNNNFAPDETTGESVRLDGCNHCIVTGNNLLHGLNGIKLINGSNHIISSNLSITITEHAITFTSCNSCKMSDNNLISTGDCLVIDGTTLELQGSNNSLTSFTGKGIATNGFRPSNTFNDRNNFFTQVGDAIFGESQAIASISNVGATKVNLMKVYVPQYSSAYLTITVNGVASGGGNMSRQLRVNLMRADTASTVTVIEDINHGVEFDIELDRLENYEYVNIGVKLGATGTALHGQMLVEAKGMLTKNLIPTY